MLVSDALQSLLLEMGQQRALDGVLRVVVDRLAEEEQIALAQVTASREKSCDLRMLGAVFCPSMGFFRENTM